MKFLTDIFGEDDDNNDDDGGIFSTTKKSTPSPVTKPSPKNMTPPPKKVTPSPTPSPPQQSQPKPTPVTQEQQQQQQQAPKKSPAGRGNIGKLQVKKNLINRSIAYFVGHKFQKNHIIKTILFNKKNYHKFFFQKNH